MIKLNMSFPYNSHAIHDSFILCIYIYGYIRRTHIIYHITFIFSFFFFISCSCIHINHHIPTYHFIRSSSIYHASVFHASMFLNYHIHLPYHTSCNIFYLYTLACINIHILSRSIHYNPFHTTYPIYIFLFPHAYT